ncbi:MAG: radical SAM protein [Fibrobacterota bacterium]
MRLLRPSKYVRVLDCLLKNRRAKDNIYPFYASFKLTSRCHFACKFCNIRNDTRPDLATDRVKAVLDNLARSSVLLVSFEGGEPLLRPDIGELLAYARRKDFYLLFTTSERNLERYPMREYGRLIDFLHVSIDEGHNNLALFDRLEEYKGYCRQLSVQVVITSDTVNALESKAARCRAAGANMVIMPAVQMNRTESFFPDLDRFEAEVERLKRKYPGIIYTPGGYFDALRQGRCSSASVIVDSDGTLFYPCHIRETRGPDLAQADLMEYLPSPAAAELRNQMRACDRRCGWFQYFSIGDFTSFRTAFRALRPAMSGLF